jgi:hypothetical protein
LNGVVLDDAFGATASFKIFDPSRDSVLSAAEAAGQTELSVAGASSFVVGDDVEVTLDSGSFQITDVTAVDPDAGTITVGTGLTGNAAQGKRVRKIFGVAIAMSEFGTPSFDTTDWGFRSNIPNDHVVYDDLRSKDGLDANVEITFLGGPGLTYIDVLCITIQEKDCA